MVTMDQVRKGLTEYVDAEILPRIPGYKRYALMVYLALVMENIQNKAVQVMRKPSLAVLGIMDENGMVDIDRMHKAAVSSMRENLDVDIPVIGRFIFSQSDVEKLFDLIRRS